jgi:hypothetical protein
LGGGWSSGEDKEENEHDLQQLPSCTKVCNDYETVKSFFFMCKTVISVRTAHFKLGTGIVLSETQLITNFFRKKMICMQVLA